MLQMISVVPTSKILLVLASFLVVLASLNLISNWMQVAQVGASPVTITDPRRDTTPRRFCADILADEIHLVCAGQFLSLSDAFREYYHYQYGISFQDRINYSTIFLSDSQQFWESQ